MEAFRYCSSLTSITIPDSVTSIGSRAFSGCSSLTSVTLPNSVTFIGGGVFYGCTHLTSAIIPGSITFIAGSAFESCEGLTNVMISDGVTAIGKKAFYNCPSLISVTIPNSITAINLFAFDGCSGLISAGLIGGNYNIKLGWTETIPNKAFMNSKTLTNVTIPNGVTSIGEDAFCDCRSLTSITIPNSVTSIGEDAFYDCRSLTNVTIPNSVTSIGGAAFRSCSGLTSVTISNSVTSIGAGVFYGCSGLTSVTIPSSVTSIGERAFSDCVGLTSITIPGSVDFIDSEAFLDCSGLTSAGPIGSDCNIKFGWTEAIPDGAFRSFNSLTNATISNSVTSIGKLAFYGCGGLTSAGPITGEYNIKFGWTKAIPDKAFMSFSNLTSAVIPDGVTSIGESAFAGCDGLTSIMIPSGVTSIGESAFSDCNGLTSVTIPNSVTFIGESAFYNCGGLTSAGPIGGDYNIKLGWTEAIPDGAFKKCTGLTNVTIPNSVTSIGEGAFNGCRGLTSVTIPNSVTSIGETAFSSCLSLTSVTLPNSVTSIKSGTFANCSALTSIKIPSSVTSIANRAFVNSNNLKDVYYSGTEVQWKNVERNSELAGVTIHYNSLLNPEDGNLDMSQENSQYTLAVGGELKLALQLWDGGQIDVNQLNYSTSAFGVVDVELKEDPSDASKAWIVLHGRAPGQTTLTVSRSSLVDLGTIDLNPPRVSQVITVIDNREIRFDGDVQYRVSCDQTLPISVRISGLTAQQAEAVEWRVEDTNANVSKEGLIPVVIGGCATCRANLAGVVAGNTYVVVTTPDGRSGRFLVSVIGSKNQYTVKPPRASGDLGEKVRWSLSDVGVLTIQGTGAVPDYASVADTPWSQFRTQIKTVKLNEGITGVGKNAFQNFTALEKVEIPKTLTYISENAFQGDNNLKRATYGGSCPTDWEALKKNVVARNEPITRLSRDQIDAYTQQDKPLRSNSYNANQRRKNSTDAAVNAFAGIQRELQTYLARVKAQYDYLDIDETEDDARRIEAIRNGPLKSDFDTYEATCLPAHTGISKEDRQRIMGAICLAFADKIDAKFDIGNIDLNKGKIGNVDLSTQLISVQIISKAESYVEELLKRKTIADTTVKNEKTGREDRILIQYGQRFRF